MASAKSELIVLVLISVFSISYQAVFKLDCVKCINGRKCENVICDNSADGCAMLRDKDNKIIAQKCGTLDECQTINDNGVIFRAQLAKMTEAQKRLMSESLASSQGEMARVFREHGLEVNIEAIAHYKCSICNTRRCNEDVLAK